MSGHSKWHSIRHKKALIDARRGQKFTRLIREITIAARVGGGNPDANPRLRTAIQAARDVSMPNKNIEGAIAKGSGSTEGSNYEELVFEGYGPGGAAFIIECSTDNRNRTAADVRHMFQKHGGNLGEAGCVSFLFDKKGEVQIEADADAEEGIMMAALDAGADDVSYDDGTFNVYTQPRPELMLSVREALEKAGYKVTQSELTRVPTTSTNVEGKDAQACLKLYDMLEGLDDAQHVFANFDVSESEAEAFESANK